MGVVSHPRGSRDRAAPLLYAAVRSLVDGAGSRHGSRMGYLRL